MDEARKLARVALAAQPALTVDYVREQEWYRDRAVLNQLVQRLLDAGVPERPRWKSEETVLPLRATPRAALARSGERISLQRQPGPQGEGTIKESSIQ
jgi:hypothetical protein